MVAVAILLLAGGCVTQHERVIPMSISMMLLNHGAPFVSQSFAERLALLVIGEKYPGDLFVVRGKGTVTDKGEVWAVTFENALVDPEDPAALPMVEGNLTAKRLTITIRKTNGEIVAIS
jgi:hypothetical protein